MDYLRSGYISTIRPYRDADDTIQIRWYRAAPGAKEYTGPTCFRSLVWEDSRFDPTVGPGELTRWMDNTYASNAITLPPGTEYHGPAEWFESGIPFAHASDPVITCPVVFPGLCLLAENGVEIDLEQGSGCIQTEQ